MSPLPRLLSSSISWKLFLSEVEELSLEFLRSTGGTEQNSDQTHPNLIDIWLGSAVSATDRATTCGRDASDRQTTSL